VIAALILAAGESSRMDYYPKANMMFRGKTFLETGVETIRKAGISQVYVVLGADFEKIKEKHPDLEVIYIINEQYKLGQLRSLQKGLDALPGDITAVISHQVDRPLIKTDTFIALKETYLELASPIIVPIYNGRRGHPVLLSREMFEDLKNAPLDVGARQVIWDNVDKITEIDTNDPGVLVNINTPLDYNKWCLRCSSDK